MPYPVIYFGKTKWVKSLFGIGRVYSGMWAYISCFDKWDLLCSRSYFQFWLLISYAIIELLGLVNSPVSTYSLYS